MKTLRRVDFYGQVFLGTLMMLSVPILFLYGFMAGLLILVCWQLLSAGLNTAAFIHSGFRKEIVVYWKWTAIVLILLFLTWPLSGIFDPDDVVVIGYTGIACTPVIALFYLKIYNKLIAHLALRNELSGFTKSKL